MAARVSAAARVELSNVAETAINRFAGDHYLWHKHVHNVELDVAQIFKMKEMDDFLNTVDFSCRRTGKTAVKELYNLEHNALHSDQEVGIVAPREAQALVNLGYHLDGIKRSEMLTAFLDYDNGRPQRADTYYQFANRSRARAYGIMSQVDGGDLTCASLEEVDDMPKDRLYSNFLLMLGSNRRLGASEDAKNDPQIRITGVFKGADTLSEMVDNGNYHSLMVIDVNLGIEMGIIQEKFMNEMRDELSAEEYIRQLLCKNVSARNLIWEKYLRAAVQVGVSARLGIISPDPVNAYKKRGLVSFGYDHSGHGESATASRSALVVWEQIGNTSVCIYARTWKPGEDDAIVKGDLISLWRYFMPDYAMGDAFGVALLTILCDELFDLGLTAIDRRLIGGGESTASTWNEWPFSPIRFDGFVKHQMAQSLRSVFHQRRAALPYLDDLNDESSPEIEDMRKLVKQFANIKAVPTKASYFSYQMIKEKVGDDLFDAGMAGIWALVTRGAAPAPAAISIDTVDRGQILSLGPVNFDLEKMA